MDDSVTFARNLWRDQTAVKHCLWAMILLWRDSGRRWQRQAPVGRYAVDFICKRTKLVFEVDGESHDQARVHLAIKAVLVDAPSNIHRSSSHDGNLFRKNYSPACRRSMFMICIWQKIGE